MAKAQVDYFSDALGRATSMTVLLPEQTAGQVGAAGAPDPASTPASCGPPVLYLLHGLSDDHSAWARRSSVERHAESSGLVVVMPDGERGFYADSALGAHWTHLSEELPAKVASFFGVSTRREDTFVAGLSMGGYGAMRWALREPGRFAAAASLSGALDLARQAAGPDPAAIHEVFGLTPGPDDDLFALLDSAEVDDLPALYLGCGTEDHLYPDTVRMAQALRGRGLDPEVAPAPGVHDWTFWDAHIPRVLAWLPRGH